MSCLRLPASLPEQEPLSTGNHGPGTGLSPEHIPSSLGRLQHHLRAGKLRDRPWEGSHKRVRLWLVLSGAWSCLPH